MAPGQRPLLHGVARTAHIVLGFVLGILAGVVTNSALALGFTLQFPMFVAMGAVAHPLFLTASNRRNELRDLARLSTFTLGYVLLAAAIGPGSLAAGSTVMKLMLVLTTFVALYRVMDDDVLRLGRRASAAALAAVGQAPE